MKAILVIGVPLAALAMLVDHESFVLYLVAIMWGVIVALFGKRWGL